MNETIIVKAVKIISNQHVSNQVLVVTVTLLLTLAGVFSLSSFSFPMNAYGQTSSAVAKIATDLVTQTQQHIHAQLIYNNQHYDMSPFVLVNNEGQLNKIQFPAMPPDSNPELTVQKCNPISFQFSKQPVRVDAFVADYDGYMISLHALKKMGSSNMHSFELSGPTGVYDLEVHALFPDGQYTSYITLADIQGSSVCSNGTDSTNRLVCDLIDFCSARQKSCNNPTKLEVTADEASIQNEKTKNEVLNIIDRNLSTVWSVNKGIDIMSFAQSLIKHSEDTLVNKNPWIQLDLGQEKSICDLVIAFGNGEQTITFFTVEASKDGRHFEEIGSAQSTGATAGRTSYSFADLPSTTRYVRITNLGNIARTGLPSIAELSAIGR